ncbi:MAG: DUF1674 domain-containing protein [Sulfitobacter sp.]
MTDAPKNPEQPFPDVPQADLPPAAQRALAEAAERRKAGKTQELPAELGGRDGPEPVRYGDWEKKGIAVDF